MHFYGNDISNINFENSVFDYLSGGESLDKSLLNFKSYDEYMSKLNNNEIKMAVMKQTVMTSGLKNDLFFLGIFYGFGRFFREPLKVALEKEKITGFRLEEVGYVVE